LVEEKEKDLERNSNQIKNLQAGDLVCIEWCDASISNPQSNGVGGIDVPVKSWAFLSA
jgi:hypothetical protein